MGTPSVEATQPRTDLVTGWSMCAGELKTADCDVRSASMPSAERAPRRLEERQSPPSSASAMSSWPAASGTTPGTATTGSGTEHNASASTPRATRRVSEVNTVREASAGALTEGSPKVSTACSPTSAQAQAKVRFILSSKPPACATMEAFSAAKSSGLCSPAVAKAHAISTSWGPEAAGQSSMTASPTLRQAGSYGSRAMAMLHTRALRASVSRISARAELSARSSSGRIGAALSGPNRPRTLAIKRRSRGSESACWSTRLSRITFKFSFAMRILSCAARSRSASSGSSSVAAAPLAARATARAARRCGLHIHGSPEVGPKVETKAAAEKWCPVRSAAGRAMAPVRHMSRRKRHLGRTCTSR
mmetsp:Transcript_116287/g.371109  ORF Transcript_116287/g.371109 Transcript_116287/m.371109 type:complete len:362 (+) Transcript_116287:456-1541(+)